MNAIDEFGNLPRTGVALIVSGPSGVGKSTICAAVLKEDPQLHFSVSCTTRPPRPGETDGKDYHFVSADEFQRLVDKGEMLEHANVHGNFYGTPRSGVVDRIRKGEDVLLDIDVQGAMTVKSLLKNDIELATAAEFVFIAPPSLAELERRLRGRETDSEETIQRRLRNATGELAKWREYEYLLVNGCSDGTAIELRRLLATLRLKVKRIIHLVPVATTG